MADTAQDRHLATAPGGTGASDGLIGGAFTVALDQPLPALGGGLPAFAVHDRKGRRAGLMALQARPGLVPRSQALAVLATTAITGLATPVAHGPAPGADGLPAHFVICRAPDGPPVGAAAGIARRWGEAELVATVLRPIAAALAALDGRRLTHRAIRPDNVFQAVPGQPVTLGAAWVTPPAALQPAAFEPPYAAICLPAGRGDGTVADDVYALGVLLLALAAGAWPMQGLDEAEVIRRKLAAGSFAALAGERPVPGMIAELARGMLAEDPEHRPSPAQLRDPESARQRRVAARPVRQAQRPLEVEGWAAWSARALAGALAAAPASAIVLLRDGSVDRWLRRSLGDANAAVRVEEAVRARAVEMTSDEAAADALMVTRAVALLDPLAPASWRGVTLFPDGLGPALAAAEAAQREDLRQFVTHEAAAAWAGARAERADPASLRVEARQHRALVHRRGWLGGLGVLRYALNPLCACQSRVLAGQLVVRLPELLPALEAAAARPDRPATALPLDAESAAFIVAREELRTDRHLAALAELPPGGAPGEAALAQLRVLARLQDRLGPPRLPALAAWMGQAIEPALAVWHSRARRRQMQAAVAERAAEGRLAGLLALVDDPAQRDQDAREAQAARGRVAQIDAGLAALEAQRARRGAVAAHGGQDVAAACGLIALSSVALWLVL